MTLIDPKQINLDDYATEDWVTTQILAGSGYWARNPESGYLYPINTSDAALISDTLFLSGGLISDSTNSISVQDMLTVNQDGIRVTGSGYFADRVGIGTEIPDYKLSVIGDGAGTSQAIVETRTYSSTNVDDRSIFLLKRARNTEASPQNIQNGDSIGSFQANCLSNTWYNIATIEYEVDGTFVAGQRPPGRMIFGTTTANGSITNRMVIKGAGDIGIGTDTPADKLDVVSEEANSAKYFRTFNSSPRSIIGIHASKGTYDSPLPLTNDNDAGEIMFIQQITSSGTAVGAHIGAKVEGTPGLHSNPVALRFMTTEVDTTSRIERMRITSSGNVVLEKSLTIGIIDHESADIDKILVSNSGIVRYRTGAEILSDIDSSGHLHDGDILEHDGLNSDGGAFPFDTTGIVSFNRSIEVAGSGYFAENVGIGVTPDADWETGNAGYHALQIGNRGAIAGRRTTTNPIIFLSENVVHTTGNADEYIASDEASQYIQIAGTHLFRVAPLGTAGNAISWTDALEINNSGYIGINIQPDANWDTSAITSLIQFPDGAAGTPISIYTNNTANEFGIYNNVIYDSVNNREESPIQDFTLRYQQYASFHRLDTVHSTDVRANAEIDWGSGNTLLIDSYIGTRINYNEVDQDTTISAEDITNALFLRGSDGLISVKTTPNNDWVQDAGGTENCVIEFSKGNAPGSSAIYSANSLIEILQNAYNSEADSRYNYTGNGEVNRMSLSATAATIYAVPAGVAGNEVLWGNTAANVFMVASNLGTIVNSTGGDHDYTVRASGINEALFVRGSDGLMGIKCFPDNDWKQDSGDTDYCALEFSNGAAAGNASIYSYNGTLSLLQNVIHSEGDNRYNYFGAGLANRVYMSAETVYIEAAGGGLAGDEVTFTTGNRFGVASESTWGTQINAYAKDYDCHVNASGITDALFVKGSDGFVGVGTGSPGQLLEVRKDQNTGTVALVKNDTAGTSAYAALDLQSNSCEGVLYCFDDGYTGNTQWPNKLVLHSDSNAAGLLLSAQNGEVQFYTEGVASANKRMTIDSSRVDMLDNLTVSGDVGIGTYSPTEILHIQKDQNDATIASIINNTGGTGALAGYRIQTNSSSASVYLFDDGYTGNTEYQDKLVVNASTDASGLILSAAASDGTIGFYTAGTGSANKRMTIDEAGDVGIGTDSPSVKLHVATTAVGNAVYISDDHVNLDLSVHSSTQKAYIGTTNNYELELRTNGNQVMTLLENGNVGIGDDTPSNLLSVTAADGVMDNSYVSIITNQEATADRNYGLAVVAGSSDSDNCLSLGDKDETPLMKVNGVGETFIHDLKTGQAHPASYAQVYVDLGTGKLYTPV